MEYVLIIRLFCKTIAVGNILKMNIRCSTIERGAGVAHDEELSKYQHLLTINGSI